MVVHLVPDQASDLADIFGGETGDQVDKFTRCAWSPGPAGTPVLDDCKNWFAGRILERLESGDHWIYVLDPFQAAGDTSEEPFTFHRAQSIAPGHEA